MSTRSSIAYVYADGKVKSVYCHFDGYPEGVGACLAYYHNNEEDAKHIVELGDLSSLNKLLDPTTKEHTFETPEEDVTVVYGRDRGEKGVEARAWQSLDDWLESAWDMYDAEYCYWWADGKWNCISTDTGGTIDLYELVKAW